MLSHKVLTRNGATGVAAYFSTKDDYFSKDGDSSKWYGAGAEALGLSGPVDAARFKQLLNGEVVPGVNARVGKRKDSKERIGIDLTLSAPKSVSIAALVSGRADAADIIKAHDRAVRRMMEAAESLAQARRKERGKTLVERTGNLIFAAFRHETSRAKDPNLHTHVVIPNLTERADGKWVALHNDEIIKATKYLGAVYRAELALELTKLGYQLRHGRDGNFELAHIDRKQIEGFSQRTAQIEAKLAAQGLTETATYKQQKQATMATRLPKVATDRELLFSEWQTRARSLGIDFDYQRELGARHPVNKELAELVTAEAARRSVRYAINHLTERQAIIGERELIDTAVKHGIGNVRLVDIAAAIRTAQKSGFLLREAPRYQPAAWEWQGEPQTRADWISTLTAEGKQNAREHVDNAIRLGSLTAIEPRYTTQTGIEREHRILAIERTGRGALQPVMAPERAALALASTDLNDGQRAAAAIIASTQNRVVGIQGYAGTGKSHMLMEAKRLVDGAGFDMRSLAPYGSQVKALRELGVQSVTVAAFLKAKDKHLDARSVLVVDEAGVLPARQMAQVLGLAQQHGARVVLMGDDKQLPAIQAGKPFGQLQQSGMETARLVEIQRQKNPELRRAVEYAAQGDTVNSLQHIDSITEIKDDQERRRAIAEAYVALAPAEREKTIVVSGTNEARREINAMVRKALGLAGTGAEFDTLIRRDTTVEERKWSKHYRPNDVIQPEKDYANGLKRGQTYAITETGPGNKLTVRGADGEQIVFDPIHYAHLSVYEPLRQEIAVGDTVRITRNDAALDISNGDRFTVAAIDDGRLRLDNGARQIEIDASGPLHLDHAIVTTTHSAQGLTARHAFLDIESGKQTTSLQAYYVAISRAKIAARLFTDDLAKLPAGIARESIKHSALELVRERQFERQHQMAA